MWARAVLLTAGRGPWPLLLSASLLGWALLVASPWALALPELCGDLAAGGLRAALTLADPTALAWSWSAMLLAMTPPLLAQPLWRLWRGSLRRRRVAAVGVFLLGYAAIWLLAGGLLTLSAIALAAGAGPYALAVAIGLALAWQVAPVKAACLARGHRAPNLRAFGPQAEFDALAYGAVTGLWCVGACWPLMLAPLVAEGGHLAAMAVAAAVMFVERYAPPRRVARPELRFRTS